MATGSDHASTRDPLTALGNIPPLIDRDPDCVIGGGWLGYIGYDPDATDGLVASSHLTWHSDVLVFAASTGQWWIEALVPASPEHTGPEHTGPVHTGPVHTGPDDSRRRALDRAEAKWTAAIDALAESPLPFDLGELAAPDRRDHLAAVEQAVIEIHSGEIFQANVCGRFTGSGFSGSPAALAAAAVERYTPSYAAVVWHGDQAVVSTSPELFLRRDGNHVVSAPIKGTSPRVGDPVADEEAARSLARSAKESAENLIIVDLIRNDLGITAEPGSVRADRLLEIEPHPRVWHLVSYVEADLSPATSTGDVLAGALPAGSVTGAPKKRATEVIAAVESQPRGVYTGVLGFAGPLRRDTWSVVIRTFEIAGNRIEVGSGGGITAGSEPWREWNEVLAKVVGLIEGLGGRVTAGSGSPGNSAGVLPFADPDLADDAVFDTALVLDGVVIDQTAHDIRLFGEPRPMPTAGRRLGQPNGRRSVLRRRRAPGHDEFTPLGFKPNRSAAVALRMSADHRYPVKAVDRTEFELMEATSPGDEVVVTDADGFLLEGTRSNVFVVQGDRLVTPVLDGRILPGVTRRRVILLARSLGLNPEVGAVSVRDLGAISEAFLTSSISGVRPVSSIAISPEFGAAEPTVVTLPDPGPVTLALRHAYDRWAYGYVADLHAGARIRLDRSTSLGAVPGGAGRRVTVIDNYDSFTYNLVQALRSLGCDVEVMSADFSGAFDPTLRDAVVISPGPSDPANAGRSKDVVLECARAGVALLGVCLGHQCIAEAFGATVGTALWPVHGRASTIHHDGRGVFSGLPDPLAAARYHSLAVSPRGFPAMLEVSGLDGDGQIMALRHRHLPIEGVQFHPESVLTGQGSAMLANFLATAASSSPLPDEVP